MRAEKEGTPRSPFAHFPLFFFFFSLYPIPLKRFPVQQDAGRNPRAGNAVSDGKKKPAGPEAEVGAASRARPVWAAGGRERRRRRRRLRPWRGPMASASIDIEDATQHLRDILKLDRPGGERDEAGVLGRGGGGGPGGVCDPFGKRAGAGGQRELPGLECLPPGQCRPRHA